MRTSIRVLVPALVTVIVGAGLTALPAAPVQAAAPVSWTVVPTGTTDDITALDYLGDRIVFATRTGKIYAGPATGPFALQLDQSMSQGSFSDLKFSPDGTHALAVGTLQGHAAIYSWDGATWSYEDLSAATYDTNGAAAGIGDCSATAVTTTPAMPAQPLLALAWVDDATAYVVGRDEGVVLKGGPGVPFRDADRANDGTCKVADTLTDVAASSGSLWLTSEDQATLYHADYGLGLERGGLWHPYGFTGGRASVAVSADDASDVVSLVYDRAGSNWARGLAIGFSDMNGGLSWSTGSRPALRDVAAVSNLSVVVGDDGTIQRRSGPGAIAESIGDGTSTRWNAVSLSYPAAVRPYHGVPVSAAVGGAGGRLIVAGVVSTVDELPWFDRDGSSPVARVIATRRWVEVKVRIVLVVPPEVASNAACQGVVKLALKKAGKTLAKAQAKVKNSCEYRKYRTKFRVPRAKVGSAKLLRLDVVLTKNKTFGRVEAAYPVVVPLALR